MPTGKSFPLWVPEPGLSLPLDYRLRGVSIGDVGLITPDGAFDYLFNICCPSTNPVNHNGVPEDFEPIRDWNYSADVNEVEFLYPPGGHVASSLIERSGFVYLARNHSLFDKSKSTRHPSIDPRREFVFHCRSSEGAVLTMPDGASRQDLRNLSSFQEYASRNADNWYKYANGIRGRQARNGSIYLITGCDKSESWGVAAFTNVTRSDGFFLKFATWMTEFGPLRFWQASSVAKTRTGPITANSTQGTHGRAKNQCLFLRGFRIAMGKGPTADLDAETNISRIQDIDTDDIFTAANLRSPEASPSQDNVRRSSSGGTSPCSGHGDGQDFDIPPNPPCEFDVRGMSVASFILPHPFISL